MRTTVLIAPWTVFILCLSAVSSVPHGAVPGAALDTAYIRQNYVNGEFDGVMDSLEAWRKNGSKGSHSDSVFAFKHLGIVYASFEATRARSESYLNLLLRLEPGTDVLDPFITDSMEVFWEKIKARNRKLNGSQGPKGNAAKQGVPRVEEKEGRGFPWGWTMGITAVVGGVAAYFFLSQDEPAKKDGPGSQETAIIRIRITTQP